MLFQTSRFFSILFFRSLREQCWLFLSLIILYFVYLIFLAYRIKIILDFPPVQHASSLFAHAAIRAKNKRTEPLRYIRNIHTRLLSCLHSLFSTCHWHRHVRAVERKLFFQVAKIYRTQIRYTTHMYIRMHIYVRQNNLFADIKLGIFLSSTKVNSLMWRILWHLWIMIKIFFLTRGGSKNVCIYII